MAEMWPNSIPSDAPPSEKLLFSKLQTAPGTQNWIVLHSLDIFGDIRGGQGEADFVVFVPGKGVLVIETKGHSDVRIVKGQWQLSGKIDKRGPLKQASNAMHAILNYLKVNKVVTKNVYFSFCAWFTNSSDKFVPTSIERKPWHMRFIADLNRDIKTEIETILEMSLNNSELVHKFDFKDEFAPFSRLKTIAESLRPDTYIVKSPSDRVAEIENEIRGALDQQLMIMNLISGSLQNFVIQGIAGTGKTYIAVNEAKRAHQRGERTLFVCFNSLLADYLKEELRDYSLVEVSSMHAYLLKVAGLSFKDAKGPDWWKNELPKIALEQLVNTERFDRFDTLIVDEGQDLGHKPYLDVLDLSLAAGKEKSSVMIFGDFLHQGIYMNGTEALINIKLNFPGITVLANLDVNCRNTREIGETIIQFVQSSSRYSRYLRSAAGPIPVFAMPADDKDLASTVKSHLNRLAKTYNPENVVVLSSNSALLLELMLKTGLPSTELGLKQKGRFRVGTAQSFKGLESLAVVIVEFADGNAATTDIFYVAGTRATAELVCILPKHLNYLAS